MRPKVLLGILVSLAVAGSVFGQDGPPPSTSGSGTSTEASPGTPSGTPPAAPKTGSPNQMTGQSRNAPNAPSQTKPPGSNSVTALISFPDSRPREVWAQAGPCTGPTADSIKPDAAVVEVPLGGKQPSDNVYIWDHQSGDMASTTVAAVRKAVDLNIGGSAFLHVAALRVRVEHMGQPVASAEVRVTDGSKTAEQLLEPTTKGEVTFYDLAPGSVKISVQFKTKDGATKAVTQIFDAALHKGDAANAITISIADDVATAAANPTGGGAPATTVAVPANATGNSPAPNSAAATPGGTGTATPATGAGATAGTAPNPGNPAGSAFGYLLGLVIVAGLVYLAYRYAKQNPDLVQSKLHQMGVDVPKAGDAPQQYDPVAPAAPRQPEPLQKIILENAAPEPLAAGPAFAASAAAPFATGGEPRLVSEAGDAMTLTPGDTVVGRDAGLGLSLVGESTVSRKHAQIVRNGSEVSVTDLGSTNGTYVNGVALAGTQTLRPGDTVQFGAVRFRFEG